MKIAIAQINCTVGDLAGNVSRILDFAARARAQSADILITPELAICGYPPEDLLLRDDFYRDCAAALARLAAATSGITVVVGHPRQSGGKRYNAASVVRDGMIIATYDKWALPNYTVFDEQRYFEPGEGACGDHAGTEVLLGETHGADLQRGPCADVPTCGPKALPASGKRKTLNGSWCRGLSGGSSAGAARVLPR